MNEYSQGKSYIRLKRSDPYCAKCTHRCWGELAGPGSNENRVHVCLQEGILLIGASERGERRSWSKGRSEASSSSEPELTPELVELIMKGIMLHRAGLVSFLGAFV